MYFFDTRMKKLYDPKNFEIFNDEQMDILENTVLQQSRPSSSKHQRRFPQDMPRSRLAPFDLRPGADKYYTRQDVLDRVNFSRHTLDRFKKNKVMPAPVESNDLHYSYQLWLRKDFDQWLEENPEYDREKKTGRTCCDVLLHYKPKEISMIRLAAQCAYQLEVDTDEFMKHAIIHYAQQVLRLTYDDFLTQEKRKTRTSVSTTPASCSAKSVRTTKRSTVKKKSERTAENLQRGDDELTQHLINLLHQNINPWHRDWTTFFGKGPHRNLDSASTAAATRPSSSCGLHCAATATAVDRCRPGQEEQLAPTQRLEGLRDHAARTDHLSQA